MKSKQLLYLDQNTLVDVIKDRCPYFASTVKSYCASHGQAVYSPPHIEEIANIYRSGATDVDCERHISEHLIGIRELTDCWELLPNEDINAPGRLIQEDPAACLKRVIDHYELTYFAEGNEEVLRENVPAKQSIPTPLDAFEEYNLREIWRRRMFNRGFDPDCYPIGSVLRSSFKVTEGMIDICFRSLHDAGYGLESKRQTRSAIHDVSHAIYAIMADIFVTRDQRMIDKVRATYRFLNAECVVYSVDEFITFAEQLRINEDSD